MPETGTFLSKDPVEDEPPYLYVRGNPINVVDPSGLCPPGVPVCRGPDGHPIDQYYRYGDRGAPVSLFGPNPWFPTHQGVNADEFAQLIIQNSSTNVGALIRLFEINGLPGKDAKGRLRWILDKTASVHPRSYLQLALFPQDDSGFCEELADGKYYDRQWNQTDPGSTRQMGHFLIAVALGFDPEGAYYQAYIFAAVLGDVGLDLRPNPASPIGFSPGRSGSPINVPLPGSEQHVLDLIVGHEMVGDLQGLGQFSSIPAQYATSTLEARNHFRNAVGYDRQRNYQFRDNELRAILIATDPDFRFKDALPGGERVGNSMEDLRLSVKGWRFGEEVRNGSVQTRQQAASWLRREVYDPSRKR